MSFKTEQEAFWAGEFGSAYGSRNSGPELLAANLNFFAKALRRAHSIGSCIEFEANIGMNIRALQLLYPDQQQHAIEINPDAIQELAKVIQADRIVQGSILDFVPVRAWDLVLIKGVLIHVNPDYLQRVYRSLHAACSKYLLVCEYYNPTPVSIPYRGHADRLYKRDFAGEMLDAFPDLRLVDYGFAYRRDPSFPQDDVTWFLMEKRG